MFFYLVFILLLFNVFTQEGFAEKCGDRLQYCKLAKKQRRCRLERAQEFIKKFCPKTCGFCVSSFFDIFGLL
ncbi:hypothetical protein RB195_005689 [Necator americanus]|uniref:ShKT domain-containing protein n=1 Tax=Necator americanus TaxID=51031 RepID=A0ABR1BS70_NECAM